LRIYTEKNSELPFTEEIKCPIKSINLKQKRDAVTHRWKYGYYLALAKRWQAHINISSSLLKYKQRKNIIFVTGEKLSRHV